jgi:hypothetical protein
MRAADRRRIAVALGLAAASLLAGSPADARRHFVPKEHRTIQAAIDAAAPKDTVWVAAGTYAGAIQIRKPLVLFGDGGPDSTILDGGDSVRVLHIDGVKGATVIGFTIRRGRASSGGGIYCARDSSVMIASCRVEKNWESGIALWACGDVHLRELEIVENQGSGISFNQSAGILRTCLFEGNKGYTGGGLALVNSKIFLPMRDCTFVRNRAEGATGGAVNADSSEILIAECIFRENTAKVAGGAVAAMNRSDVTVSRCHFSSNRSATGGALHEDHSTLNVGYSVLHRNLSTALGSAIGYVGRGVAGVNPRLGSNTFYQNAAENAGATIFCDGVSPEIRKNIFVLEGEQKAVAGVSSSPLYECNLLYAPSGHGLTSLPSAETLVGDPLFCDPEHGDFYLRDLSPAILAPCGPIGALPKRCASFKMVPSK